MNESEFRALRAQASEVAFGDLMLWAADLLCGALPVKTGPIDTEQMSIIKRKLREHLEEARLVTFPEKSASESDLWAGELHEAYERAAAMFLDRLAASGR